MNKTSRKTPELRQCRNASFPGNLPSRLNRNGSSQLLKGSHRQRKLERQKKLNRGGVYIQKACDDLPTHRPAESMEKEKLEPRLNGL